MLLNRRPIALWRNALGKSELERGRHKKSHKMLDLGSGNIDVSQDFVIV